MTSTEPLRSLTANRSVKRIESIDLLRGIVMVLMALDHTRDFFHAAALTDDPLNLATTTPELYFTRWVTHFCAPIFVFLSGVSIYLQSQRKTKKELSAFLFKRGLWLILAEVVIITFAWTFNPFYNFIGLQVIWAIGISMVILAAAIRLPFNLVLLIGLVIVFGHNLLDVPESAPGFKAGFFWDLLHHGHFAIYNLGEKNILAIVYPFLPWTGLMLLGYCTGVFYNTKYTAERRRRIFILSGISLLIFFAALRYSNFYGDPMPWSGQNNGLLTFFSFINVQKYPPSLLYMCVTIGPALILLALIENVKNVFSKTMIVFGRTAFFYYIIHIFLIHILCAIFFFTRGHSLQTAIDAMENVPFLFQIPGEGYSLLVVYLVWIGVIVILYPVCKWYDKYKTAHKERWWLSYL